MPLFRVPAPHNLLDHIKSPASRISYAWLQQFSLPTDGSTDLTDPDGDLHNTWQEWMADTNPTNALSCFEVEAITLGPLVTVSFRSSSNRLYTLYSCTDLSGAAWTPVPGQADILGTGATLALQTTNLAAGGFYRVGVRMP